MTMKADGATSVQFWAIDKIVPYERNAKRHPQEQIDKLAKLMQIHGFTNPIQVQGSSGSIIAGHGRRLAALKLGLKKVPVIVHDVDDAQAMAMRISDNAPVSNDYDNKLMAVEVAELMKLDFDFDLGEITGLDVDALEIFKPEASALDPGAFVVDMEDTIENQKKELVAKTEATDRVGRQLGEIMGFKSLSVEQARHVKGFMAKIEEITGFKGAEALVAYIRNEGLS